MRMKQNSSLLFAYPPKCHEEIPKGQSVFRYQIHQYLDMKQQIMFVLVAQLYELDDLSLIQLTFVSPASNVRIKVNIFECLLGVDNVTTEKRCECLDKVDIARVFNGQNISTCLILSSLLTTGQCIKKRSR